MKYPPEIIIDILSRIGVKSVEEINDFLFPSLSNLPHPSKMLNINEAAELVVDTIDQEIPILIWGDYDVDGTTGTALLVNFFKELGLEPYYHVPNRLNEGYGLNTYIFDTLRNKIDADTFLLITVDCGISNREEIEKIVATGVKVIVTDHHQLPDADIPDCIIVNPNQQECGFHEDRLAGVGVAFYLAAAVRSVLETNEFFKQRTKPNLKDYLGYVALGTVSDLVELTTTNRLLVKAGLESLENPKHPGLQVLLDCVRLSAGPITSEDIAFTLGPNINAAGRLGKPEVVVDLMIADNEQEARVLSKTFEKFNPERKKLCDKYLENALSLIDRRNNSDNAITLVAGDFHLGVIGIVAAKLVEMFKKPAIVFSEIEEGGTLLLKGSGRSIEGVNLLESLNDSAAYIEKYGGHFMAAGVTVDKTKYKKFSEQIERSVQLQTAIESHQIKKEQYQIPADVDTVMSGDFSKYFQCLEPFGPLNEKPHFYDERALVTNSRVFGKKGAHLQVTLRGKYRNYRGIGFNLGDRLSDIKDNAERTIVFVPMINRFGGRVEWQIRLISI